MVILFFPNSDMARAFATQANDTKSANTKAQTLALA